MAMTRGQAWDLLTKYNKEPFHLRHAITVEHVMGWYAQELGYGMEKDFWSLVGLLHDLDFEMWPEEHCEKSQELMRDAGVEESIIRATASHGWGLRVEVKPEHEMEKVLYASDELTGLIGAVLAPLFARVFHVTQPVAEGLAIGACSHALGTARAMEIGQVQGAMSSIAICVCGILTSVLALFL